MFGQYIPLQYQIAQYLISHPRSDDGEDWEEDENDDYEEDPVKTYWYKSIQLDQHVYIQITEWLPPVKCFWLLRTSRKMLLEI